MPSKITVLGPRVRVTAVIAVVPVMWTRLPVAVSRLIVEAEAMAVPLAHSCAAVKVLAPRIAAVPTTPAAGKPVAFVSVPLDGVPRAGVTNVGLVANTREPVPVSSVTAASKFAEDGVPRNVATPVPKDVMPVPPLATGRVPVTPVVSGKPVVFVSVPLDGVPRAGVTNVGLVANTKEPVPVSSVTAANKFALEGVPKKVATPVPKDVMPVPPLATGRVPVTPVVRGRPVALVSVADTGVPSAALISSLSVLRLVKLVSISVLVRGVPLAALVVIVDI